MKNNIEKFKSLVSESKSEWVEKARYNKDNQAWLDISFFIAVKIQSKIKANKKSGINPSTQKELAIALDCSPQYVNKLMRGNEKLNIETISKIEKALDIILINIERKKSKVEMSVTKEVTLAKIKHYNPKNYKKQDKLIIYNFSNKSTSTTDEFRPVMNE